MVHGYTNRIGLIVDQLMKRDDSFQVINLVSSSINLSFKPNNIMSSWDGSIWWHEDQSIKYNLVSLTSKFIFRISDVFDASNSFDMYFDDIKDYKAFLYDLEFYINGANSIAMQCISTNTGYNIREYFGDPDKRILILEISNNQIITIKGKGIKIYLLTEELERRLKEIRSESYGDYDIITNYFEYSQFYSEKTGDFKFPKYVDNAIGRSKDVDYAIKVNKVKKDSDIL